MLVSKFGQVEILVNPLPPPLQGSTGPGYSVEHFSPVCDAHRRFWPPKPAKIPILEMFWIFREKNKQKKSSASKRCLQWAGSNGQTPHSTKCPPPGWGKGPSHLLYVKPWWEEFWHPCLSRASFVDTRQQEGGRDFFQIGKNGGLAIHPECATLVFCDIRLCWQTKFGYPSCCVTGNTTRSPFSINFVETI